MAKTTYSACAMKAKEVPFCEALAGADYPEQYAERVESFLGTIRDEEVREKARNTLSSFKIGTDRMLAQSNPYMLTILQKFLPQGQQLVARPRLEIAKQKDSNFVAGFYIDDGLNLTEQGKGYQVNKFLAQKLASDLKKAGIDVEKARLIPYNVLDLGTSQKSSDGLVFKLSKEGKDTAKTQVLNTGDFNWDYLPNTTGLFRAYLGRYGNWDAGGDLPDSGGNGRVVVETTSEAGSREIERLKQETQELMGRQKDERDSLKQLLG